MLVQVLLDRPQETFMWEHFAEYIYCIRDGARPNKHWPAKAALTNKVVVAVERSAQNGCELINLKF